MSISIIFITLIILLIFSIFNSKSIIIKDKD